MKKIKMLYEFIQYSRDKKWIVFLSIIKVYLEIPAILFHEISHFILLWITFSKYEIVSKRWYFLKKINPNEISKYSFEITILDENPLKLILIALAPILGILAYFIIGFYILIDSPSKLIFLLKFYSIIIYFILCIKCFYLSKNDIATAKNGFNLIKVKLSS